MFKFLYKLLIAPFKILTIPLIPIAWIIILMIIFFTSGGDKEDFDYQFTNLNQATKEHFISCTKGVII